jgi:prepilin-type N-terminal cleavage/methylation domain-containing protein
LRRSDRPAVLCGGGKGFTVLELIIVIVVIGILAASVSYRFSSSTAEMSGAVAVDQALADIRYTQMLAAGSGSQKSIVFDGTGQYRVPTYGESSQVKTLPGGSTASVLTITFNSLGERTQPPSSAGNVVLSIGGKEITVHAVTGVVDG